MGDKDVQTDWVQVSRLPTITTGPSAVLIFASRVASTARGGVGEEVIPWGAGPVEEPVVAKVEKGNGVEADEGRILAMVDIEVSPRTDSVLQNGLDGQAMELTPRTPDVTKLVVDSDKEGVSVSPGKVSAEDRKSAAPGRGLFTR